MKAMLQRKEWILLSILRASLLLTLLTQNVHAFVVLPPSPQRRASVVYGIHEWRDSEFNLPGSNNRPLGTDPGPAPKPVCILPFPYGDVLLQGETKQLHLYEDRFLRLFEDAITNHSGIVAMGLFPDDSGNIIQTVPLCEMEAYNRMDGFGTFVTLRVVSRAQLLAITQRQPYIKAVCTEITDELPPNLELPNLVASNIENYMVMLSSMEHQLEQQARTTRGSNETGQSGDDDPEMDRRIYLAKLEDRFYEDEDEDESDKMDEEDDEESFMDRRRRFQKAYKVALATDTQGYRVVKSQSSPTDRTAQELTALSWAAFCTDVVPDPMSRIQALDCEKLLDRLKLALHYLRKKEGELRLKLDKK